MLRSLVGSPYPLLVGSGWSIMLFLVVTSRLHIACLLGDPLLSNVSHRSHFKKEICREGIPVNKRQKTKRQKGSSVLWRHTLLRYFLFLRVQRCFIMKTTGPGSWPTRSRSRKGSSRSLETRKTIAALMKTISSRFVPFALWDNFMSAWLVKSFPNSPVGNDDLSYSILRLAVSAE